MLELGPDNVIEYLRSTGRMDFVCETGAEDSVSAEVLGWGVSNVVLRVHDGRGRAMVIKQSREQLRTKAAWFSRLDRIWREAEIMQTLSPLLPPGVIPAILFEDRENFLFGMEAIEANHVVWKESLLNGNADPRIAATLGEFLAAMHRETAGQPSLQCRFGDREIFEQLRVDPFYRRIAEVHSELRPAVQGLIDEMNASAGCVVHADFSPKNILVTSRGLSLVDFETGHYGDPGFDLGFFVSHLLLKTVRHAGRADEYLNLVTTFWRSYRTGLGVRASAGPFAEAELELRTARHIAGCMLARIDGTSPIDYLPDEASRELVRRFCRELLLTPPASMTSLLERLRQELWWAKS